MAVSPEDLARVAELARLRIDPSRAQSLIAELSGILSHMDVLRGVRTEGVQGTAGVGDAGQPLRADSGPPIPLERPPEAFAPRLPGGERAWRDGFFVVPRLATHEGAAEPPEP